MTAQTILRKIEDLETEQEDARRRAKAIERQLADLRQEYRACTGRQESRRFFVSAPGEDPRHTSTRVGPMGLADFFGEHYSETRDGIPMPVALATALAMEVEGEVEFPNGLYVERQA